MSALLSKADLNDFISPGVACIKPVEVTKTNDSGKAEIQIDSESGQAYEVSLDGTTTTDLSAAQISLSDCLACSGCITSAESVLVSLQSHTELLNAVRVNQNLPLDQQKQFTVSISHQTRASLATAYNISVNEADRRLATLFVEVLGFKYMVGMGVGREISLDYSAKEVLDRMKIGTNSTTGLNSKPILSSSCPGWICYVEKTHQYIIPYLSAVKSPQQITGSLLKEIISEELNITKERIYHLSVMPCFDKKLEAARPEFTTGEDSDNKVKDVDCVITTKEIIQLLLDEGMTFEGLSRPNKNSDEFTALINQKLKPENWPSTRSWASHEGSSSGGYLYHILTTMQSYFTATQGISTKINVITGKNSDIVEYHIVDSNNEERILSKSAQIYGFRNIQNLVRKLKPNSSGSVNVSGSSVSGLSARRLARKSALSGAKTGTISVIDPTSWAYVEVMACPGGCINGGGQIGAPNDVNVKEWKENAEIIYNTMPRLQVGSELIHKFIDNNWGYDRVDQLVLTGYTPVVSDEAVANHALTLGSKW
ncbi:iron hydrogenase [Nadsonia fulvescens var. elongata DSM 6958]|uniref:Cytosolic Fe-S cluster assembly factor NAR1 n=1 Tax=Nadsonia fulvescens var. elongata DSM 6958 TaxID=857566 RepID=A0A1E3PE32_9ASCO|nr:iron hydrogenase [Nadsonia fulvescens var. elongata DSM 6958]